MFVSRLRLPCLIALIAAAPSFGQPKPGQPKQPAQPPKMVQPPVQRQPISPNNPTTPSGGQPSKTAPFQPTSGTRWMCPRTVYDFGEVWQGAPVTYNFEIRNTSNEELEIIDARPDCHCTVAGSFNRRIPPGGTGYVPFTFMTAGMGNYMTKGATITLNDPKNPMLRVMLQGTVKTVIGMNPIGVGSFGELDDPNAVITREADLTSNVPQPVKLEMLPIQGKPPFSLELTEKEKGKKWHVVVKTVPPLPVGYLQYSFQFKTDHPKLPTWNIPANCFRPARIAARPPAVRLPDAQTGKQPVGVDILNHGKTPIKITKTEVPDLPQMKFEVKEIQGGYHVTVIPPEGQEIPNGHKLVVTTDDKEIPMIEVVLYRVVERPNLPPLPTKKSPATQPAASKPSH